MPEQFAEHLLNSLPGIAYRCLDDRKRTMTFATKGCEMLTGYTPEYVVNTKLGWVDFIHPEDINEVRLAVNDGLAESGRFDIQYRIVDRFGTEKWVREQGFAVYSSTGDLLEIDGYVDDASALRNAGLIDSDQGYSSSGSTGKSKTNAKVRMQHAQLAHADRLNTLGEMASEIAHEINQPLTAISLFAQTGRRLFESGDYDSLQNIFDRLSQHAQRAGAIVERIQSMAQRKVSTKLVIDLNSLVEGVVDLAEVDARSSDISIELDLADEPLDVKVDEVQVQQVTLNLLRNGMEAMRSIGCRNGNIIQVRTRRQNNSFLEVSVVDSGCGIPDEIADQLFDSFLSTKSTGLGMGLPISKAIVDAHGGKMSFRSNEVGGTIFAFSLPKITNGE